MTSAHFRHHRNLSLLRGWRGKEHFRLEKSIHRGLGARRRGKAAAPQRPWQRPLLGPRGSGGRLRTIRGPIRTPLLHRGNSCGTARKFRGMSGPRRCAHGKDGLGQRRFDASPGAAVSSAVSGEPGLSSGRRTKAARGSVLPREGKTRGRHPSGWLRWWCTSGRHRDRQPRCRG